MDDLLKELETISMNIDSFPVGAANFQNCVSLESEIKKVQSEIQSTNAEILLLQAMIEVANNSNSNSGRKDDPSIAKYENALLDLTSCIGHPKNLANVRNEVTGLVEALKMQPEEMENQETSLRSLLERIKNIIPECSSRQLELLGIQNDITERLKDVQLIEVVLMKKKYKYSDNLSNQKKQLNAMKGRKDKEYDRKKEELQTLADNINKLKVVIQRLIGMSEIDLTKHKKLTDIIINTRKPVNLVTYNTEL